MRKKTFLVKGIGVVTAVLLIMSLLAVSAAATGGTPWIPIHPAETETVTTEEITTVAPETAPPETQPPVTEPPESETPGSGETPDTGKTPESETPGSGTTPDTGKTPESDTPGSDKTPDTGKTPDTDAPVTQAPAKKTSLFGCSSTVSGSGIVVCIILFSIAGITFRTGRRKKV